MACGFERTVSIDYQTEFASSSIPSSILRDSKQPQTRIAVALEPEGPGLS